MKIEVETEAEVASAFRFAIATGDVLDLAPDRKRLTLTFTAGEKARHLVVQTHPPGADLRVLVTADGVDVSRSSLKMSEIAVPAAEAERLLHQPDSALRVWYLPPGGQQVEIDEETMKVLRSLGYVQ